VSASVAAAVTGLLAQAPPGAERGEEFGKTSPIALVVVLVLLLATILLIRSMSKRLRNIPVAFDDPGPGHRGRGGGPSPDAPDPAIVPDGAGQGADGDDGRTADDRPGPSGPDPAPPPGRA
jgi:hypothetical protein